jgi:hypothetical protein
MERKILFTTETEIRLRIYNIYESIIAETLRVTYFMKLRYY